jgi:glutamine amidotransferase
MRIGVLDYGAGNLRNVYRAINHLGYNYVPISSSSDFQSLDKLIIPGVGAFKVAMEQLNEKKLIDPIREFSMNNSPILGICLGMQLLFCKSFEFGLSNGLELMKGTIQYIDHFNKVSALPKVKVPHTGWAALNYLKEDDLLNNLASGSFDAYFVHSYMASDFDPSHLIASVDYNGIEIPAIVKVKNTYGCQFHPEKSGVKGLQLIHNFIELN